MGEYRFLSTWCVDAPIERVWDVLQDDEHYPDWWKGVLAVKVLEPGDEHGVGRVARTTWRSALPYKLEFDFRLTRVEPPHLIAGQASGELEGDGTWRLYEGRGTAAVYSWNVRTTRAWMNVLRPVAKPAFGWNHDVVMRRGAQGLARRLGVALIASD